MQEIARVKDREVSREEIERRAYQIYLDTGMEDGHDREHWLAAEEELRGQEELSALTDDMHSYERAVQGKERAAAASVGSSSGSGSGSPSPSLPSPSPRTANSDGSEIDGSSTLIGSSTARR
jgi:hypothetical protein